MVPVVNRDKACGETLLRKFRAGLICQYTHTYIYIYLHPCLPPALMTATYQVFRGLLPSTIGGGGAGGCGRGRGSGSVTTVCSTADTVPTAFAIISQHTMSK